MNLENFAHFMACHFAMLHSIYWCIDEYNAVSAKESFRRGILSSYPTDTVGPIKFEEIAPEFPAMLALAIVQVVQFKSAARQFPAHLSEAAA